MGKILGSWSGMGKYLEREMLAESLRGRVKYNCTRYVHMDNCHIFEVYIDDEKVKKFSLETVNSYFIKLGYSVKEKFDEYWEDFLDNMDKYPMCKRTEYTDNEFCEALEKYRNSDIQDSINSDNPIVRMFAVLDRRIGKKLFKA